MAAGEGRSCRELPSRTVRPQGRPAAPRGASNPTVCVNVAGLTGTACVRLPAAGDGTRDPPAVAGWALQCEVRGTTHDRSQSQSFWAVGCCAHASGNGPAPLHAAWGTWGIDVEASKDPCALDVEPFTPYNV